LPPSPTAVKRSSSHSDKTRKTRAKNRPENKSAKRLDNKQCVGAGEGRMSERCVLTERGDGWLCSMTSPRPTKPAPDAREAVRQRKNRSMPHSPRAAAAAAALDTAAPPLPPDGQLAADTVVLLATRGVNDLPPYDSTSMYRSAVFALRILLLTCDV
jgi:hypothetical protein